MNEGERLYLDRIVTDSPEGEPVVKGTRIAVQLVLKELSHDPDIGRLLTLHPNLKRDDVRACLSYARAVVAGEPISPLPGRKPPASRGVMGRLVTPILGKSTPRAAILIHMTLFLLLLAIFLVYVKQW